MIRKYALLILVLPLAALLTVTPAQAQVGDDMCIQCHDGIQTAVAKTVHVQANGVSCESCHGNGDTHVDDMTADTIRSFRDPNPEMIRESCGQCHVDMHPIASSHLQEGESCLSCHNMAHSMAFMDGKKEPERALVNETSTDLCFDCHSGIRAKTSRPYHHPDDDFEIGCVQCHNPHATRSDQLGHRMDDRCGSCHPEVSGPFMYVHLGTEQDGCDTCHDPHGSTQPNLLNRHSTRVLCLSCHTDTPAFHDQTDPLYRQCTACHSAVHGSNVNNLLME